MTNDCGQLSQRSADQQELPVDLIGVVPAETEYAQTARPVGSRVFDTRDGTGLEIGLNPQLIKAGEYLCANLGLNGLGIAETGDVVQLSGVIPFPEHHGYAAIVTEEQAQVYDGSTSTLNFWPESANPNGAELKLGEGGKVCIAASRHGDINGVLDVGLVIPGDTEYAQSFMPIGQRVIDWRLEQPPIEVVDPCADHEWYEEDGTPKDVEPIASTFADTESMESFVMATKGEFTEALARLDGHLSSGELTNLERAWLLQARASVLLLSGDIQSALTAELSATELAPDLPILYTTVASIYGDYLGDRAKAKEYADIGLQKYDKEGTKPYLDTDRKYFEDIVEKWQ